MHRFPPSRIVCLTEETVETLYLLGEQDRIVGVSGYTVRPPEARRDKPRVSAFISADIADALAKGYEARLAEAEAAARGRPRPSVYFEEWDDPLISGIGWVSELIEIAGGEEVFPELRKQKAARDRIVSPEDVIGMAPDIILASWCGKKVVPDKIRQRPGWDAIPAVRNGRIIEI